MKFKKLNDNQEFKINDYTTIQKFKIISNKIFQFMKYGELYDYLKFKGTIENKKIEGYVCLADENIYMIKYLNN